jgi:flagellar motor switch protein FliG
MTAMAKDPKLTGVEKAAVLLMNIGEDLATEVFKYMTPPRCSFSAAPSIRKESVSLQTGRQVVNEFIETINAGEVMVEGLEFAKTLITKALGPEKAQSLLEQITREMGKGGIESLRWMDPALVANIVRSEHPQIIAIILTHLDPDRAASAPSHT